MQRIRPFGYSEPGTLREASDMLLAHGDQARILAGGTDLVVMLRRLRIADTFLINIKRIPDLSGIRTLNDGGIEIGALTTVTELESLKEPHFAVLSQAAAVLGTRSVRNLATIGGNVGRASPASDLASPLLVLGAEVLVYGADGQRTIPISEFFLAPGKTALRPGELITALRIPPQPDSSGCYRKAGRTCGSDCAQAGVAVQLSFAEGRIRQARVALTAVGPVPLAAPKTQSCLENQLPTRERFVQAAEIAVEEARPLTDFRASAEYRRVLIRDLAFTGLATAAGIADQA